MKVLIADAINEKGIENLKEVADVVVDTEITPEELANTLMLQPKRVSWL